MAIDRFPHHHSYDKTTSVAISTSTSATPTNYTPQGSVSGSIQNTYGTTSICSVTQNGTVPTFYATIDNKKVTINFGAGSAPTLSEPTTVVTSVASTLKNMQFTGTATKISATPAYTATSSGAVTS